MILDAQNLHTFSQTCQTPGVQPYKCYFKTPFSCFLTCQTREVSFVQLVRCCCFERSIVFLDTFLPCVCFFE